MDIQRLREHPYSFHLYKSCGSEEDKAPSEKVDIYDTAWR